MSFPIAFLSAEGNEMLLTLDQEESTGDGFETALTAELVPVRLRSNATDATPRWCEVIGVESRSERANVLRSSAYRVLLASMVRGNWRPTNGAEVPAGQFGAA